MFRIIGAVTVIGALAAGALYATGYWDGSASVAVTSKGKQALNSGIQSVQSGLSDGLEHLKVDDVSAEVGE